MATFGRLYLINNQNECNIMVLMAYAKYPGIETLFKNGLSDIVKVVILRGSSNLTSKKETKANRILGISKEQYHWLVNYDGDSYIALNMMKKYHIDIKDMPYVTRILSYRLGGRRFDFNTSMDNLTYAHQYLSYCQIYNYLSRQNENNGITLYELLNEYVDYLKMRQALEYDMTNPVYIRPKSLRMTYAALRREYKREKNTIYEKEMAIKYSQIAAVARKIQKKYSWQDGTLLIRPAASAIEIVREGRILHHCVGNDEQRYMDNYNKNKAYILVIRHLDTPDTPYITVEIEKNNHIRQWYGKNDKKPDKKQIEKFLEDYADYLNKRVRIAV
ncbi:MAG: PcfJ domain-containing protein [Lachnospiraceae bacterium]